MNIRSFLSFRQLFAGLILAASLPASAQSGWFENNYVMLGSQFNEVELEFNDTNDPGFTLALGTQIHPKWYAEIGYSVLAADFDLAQLDLNNSALQVGDSAGVDASGFHFSLLGKATGDSGELFYKLGVMLLDYESAWINEAVDACTADLPNIQVCRFRADETSVAGIVGLGFDFFAGFNSQVRLSVEHIFAENGFQTNAVLLGYRYNF